LNEVNQTYIQSRQILPYSPTHLRHSAEIVFAKYAT
jgi:hypothetical protein